MTAMVNSYAMQSLIRTSNAIQFNFYYRVQQSFDNVQEHNKHETSHICVRLLKITITQTHKKLFFFKYSLKVKYTMKVNNYTEGNPWQRNRTHSYVRTYMHRCMQAHTHKHTGMFYPQSPHPKARIQARYDKNKNNERIHNSPCIS